MRAMQRGTALPWTLLALTAAALDPCSCDCCVAAESHADPSGATVVTCALIPPSDDRFLSASRHGADKCPAICARGENDAVLWASGREVDAERFCADECVPTGSNALCAAQAPPSRDGNGKPNQVVQPVAFHATGKKKQALPADQWPSVVDNAHDVGFRTEELKAATEQRVDAAKQSSELAEKVKVDSSKAIPETIALVGKGQDHATAAADALRAADSWLAQAQETAGQAAASVREATIKKLVKAAHDTAEVEAKKAAAKLEADMKKAIPDAKKAAMKPWEEVSARAAAVAGEYVKAGDGLTGASLGSQLQAQQMLGSAQQFQALGEVGKAQNYMRDAHNLLGLAKGMTDSANGMYGQAANIVSTIPAYMGVTAQAAYHAEVMLNPDAPPPPPPII